MSDFRQRSSLTTRDAGGVHTDFDACVRAVQSKDARFDGWFFTAVLTTRIYCRPSCPVVPPKVRNMTFYPSAAAAQQAGFRACKRCRPDASPGSPQWNERADLVARTMRLIADGVVDRDGVPGLAARIGYSERQIERQLLAELGAGLLALARAQRAQTARLLIETTTMPMSEIAFAAGFASIRTFNDTVREVFALSPTELRARVAKGRPAAASGMITLRLPFRRPLTPDNLFGHLAATAVPGVEEWRTGAYRRTLRLPHGPGVVALRPQPDHIACQLWLADWRDLAQAISRCRRMLDLDADPTAVDALLSADPVLAPRSPKRPADGSPGSRTGRNSRYARCSASRSPPRRPAPTRAGWWPRTANRSPTRPAASPTSSLPAALAEHDPKELAMPQTRRDTLAALLRALVDGELDLDVGSDWERAREQLKTLPGFGPWTVETIAMRALGDPDAFLPTDLGIRHAARDLGLPTTPAALLRHSAAWQPWRSYATQYLWATGDHPVNFLPPDDSPDENPDEDPNDNPNENIASYGAEQGPAPASAPAKPRDTKGASR